MSYSGLTLDSLRLTGRRNWEDQFHRWGSPPSATEQGRAENAVKEVRAAINASAKLNQRRIRVFAQGSYRNRVNVREDSDVDIGVECGDVFFFDKLPEGTTLATFGCVPSTYFYPQFKNEVGAALVDYFGYGVVTRGDKAFDIKATLRQVEADVAPFFQHRRYELNGYFHQGVELHPDSGGQIINWPEQHYSSGVDKHSNRTGDRFKKVVRILKCLRNEMDGKGHSAAKPIPSFFIECLVFNAPDELFGNAQWRDDVVGVLAYISQNTSDDQRCTKWLEVSRYKWLFRGGQKWTRQQAYDFANAAQACILAE